MITFKILHYGPIHNFMQYVELDTSEVGLTVIYDVGGCNLNSKDFTKLFMVLNEQFLCGITADLGFR